MSVFFALPEGVKQKLTEYFADKPPGTKIKYGFTLHGEPVEVEASGDYVLKNSYIKLNKDIYALGRGEKATVGSGAFGTVKYIRSLSTNDTYVVKVIRYGSSDKELQAISNEVVSTYDLGLYRDEGSRASALDYKQYLVMVNAGMPLDKFIVKYADLNQAVRFDLAIKLCFSVHSFHTGMSSRTGTPYAHRDIKPANIAVGKKGEVRLIDLGIVEPNPDSQPVDLAGAPAYLPNYATFLTAVLTLRDFDILALKRSIYMPEKILCLAGYQEDRSATPFNCEMILPKRVVEETGLFKVIDTSAKPKEDALRKDYYRESALVLASLLTLARYGLMEDYADKMHNPTLAYAVLGIYFANQDLADVEMATLMESSLRAYLLARVVPRYQECERQVKLLSHLVALGITNQLNAAMVNDTLLDVLASPTPAIQRAAALLWQNGIREKERLIQLKDNEVLANQAIEFVFDGNLSGIKEVLTKSLEITLKKPLESPPVILPLIGAARAKVESKGESRTARAPVKKAKEEHKVKQQEHLPHLFFAPPKGKKSEHRCASAAQRPAWR